MTRREAENLVGAFHSLVVRAEAGMNSRSVVGEARIREAKREREEAHNRLVNALVYSTVQS
jgi:hypothetical protein